MKEFVTTLPKNFLASFRGRKIFWHLVAIVLTILIVTSDFDWKFYLWTRYDGWGRLMAFLAVGLGSLVPFVFPLALIFAGWGFKKDHLRLSGWAIGQAAFLGSIISSIYKAFTGRIPPSLISGGADISHGFNFGFLRHGIFWGWPSSHTTVAFAVSVCFIYMFRKHKLLGWLALVYALYVGLGVATTIHWFSEFVAGALIGTAIGMAVGENFKKLSP